MANRRAHKLSELLQATEKELDKIVQAVDRKRNPLRGKDKIGVRVGRIINKYKMAKHFNLNIQVEQFSYEPCEAKIAEEAALDGIYVIRTSIDAKQLSSDETVRAYKSLS